MINTNLLTLLHQEVIPAIGCTEPICVALCVARAKERLGAEPDTINVRLSKNIYKNAMAVGIPNTGMTGLPIAIALGATIGRSELGLECLQDTTPKAVAYAKAYMQRVPIDINIDEQAPDILYVHVEAKRLNGEVARATIQGEHTHFVDSSECTMHNAECTMENAQCTMHNAQCVNQELTLRKVYDFSLSTDIEPLNFLLEGAEMNLRAAEYAFEHKCGHCLGQILAKQENSIFEQILAYTSGACDARMSGAMVPIMSNSGSGNQGISCSVPVLLYARHTKANEEQTLRALALSNLTVIYIKLLVSGKNLKI